MNENTVTVSTIRAWATGVAWTLALGWISGAAYNMLVTHNMSQAAYCALSFLGVLIPGIPITKLQTWAQAYLTPSPK